MGLGRAKQHAIRHDDRAPAAHLQHPQKQRQEQQLRLAHLQQSRRHNVRVQTALEGGICQNHGVLFCVRVLVAEAVLILDGGVFYPMGHHVHGSDPQHGPVHVVAGEHTGVIVGQPGGIVENLLSVLFLEVLSRRHQKAAGAAGRVADDLVRTG